MEEMVGVIKPQPLNCKILKILIKSLFPKIYVEKDKMSPKKVKSMIKSVKKLFHHQCQFQGFSSKYRDKHILQPLPKLCSNF